jgi:hypothetical protein
MAVTGGGTINNANFAMTGTGTIKLTSGTLLAPNLPLTFSVEGPSASSTSTISLTNAGGVRTISTLTQWSGYAASLRLASSRFVSGLFALARPCGLLSPLPAPRSPR